MEISITLMQLTDLEQIKDNLLEEFDDFWTFSMLKQEIENKNNLNSTYFVAKLKFQEQQNQLEEVNQRQQSHLEEANQEQQTKLEEANQKQQKQPEELKRLKEPKEILQSNNTKNEEIIGFAGIVKIIDEINIMNIVVKKSKRKLGIGSALLQKIIEFSKKQNATSITLEVNYKNKPAIALYQKFGFKQVGLRKKYYNNTDDALLMTLSI